MCCLRVIAVGGVGEGPWWRRYKKRSHAPRLENRLGFPTLFAPSVFPSEKRVMTKLRMRDSLVQMMGEFVGLNKNPDFRLSVSSEKSLNEAIKEERRTSCVSIDSNGSHKIELVAMHGRSASAEATPSTLTIPITAGASSGAQSRRASAPILRRPQDLLRRLRRQAKSLDHPATVPNSLRNSVISESDESVVDLPRPRHRSRHPSQSSSLLGDIAKYCNEMSAIHTRI